jgi:hypothetical protein
MKTSIKLCAPILLALTIGCDQPVTLSDGVDGDAYRWGPRDTLDVGQTELGTAPGSSSSAVSVSEIERASQLIKVDRVLDLFVSQQVFFETESTEIQGVPCMIEHSPIESVDLECAGMPDEARVVDLLDCQFGAGDVFDGRMYLALINEGETESSSQQDGDDMLEDENPENPEGENPEGENPENPGPAIPQWRVALSINTGAGLQINGCGDVSTEFDARTFDIGLPNDDGDAIQYRIIGNMKHRLSKRARTLFELMDTNEASDEVRTMSMRALSYSDDSLLPQNGFAKLNGRGGDRLVFTPSLSADNLVRTNTPIASSSPFFPTYSVVEVPEL